MARVHVFADESGNFDFTTKSGASRYFVLTTVVMPDCAVGESVLALRRDMAINGLAVKASFHANEDDWPIRARMLSLIASHDLRIDSIILEKRKAQPSIRPTDERFYKMAWYLHMKYLAPKVAQAGDELVVIAASLGKPSRLQAFCSALADVVQQVTPTVSYKSGACPAAGDPCLQVADYCSWAINRKWEFGKDDAYKLIQRRVFNEFDVFRRGQVHYY